MSGNGFFELREKLVSPRKPRGAQAPDSPPADPAQAMSVTQLTRVVESAIKTGVPTSVLVRGEVSNFNFNRASGHAYFTLKDPSACINCVMFRGEFSRTKFEPGDGMELLAGGNVRVYPAQGRYQLYVNHLQPVGQGALELAFQQLRARLEEEGLFLAQRKRPVPAYPLNIAILTSRETAALADILKVLQRFSFLRLMLYHVSVQGDSCGQTIATAVKRLNQHARSVGGIDLILMARGGGSLEDLWGFNDESLARAIVASRLPIITGIGHEVDVSIADLVADHHAHTPTEAATFVVAQWLAVGEWIDDTTGRLRRQMTATLQENRRRLDSILRHEVFRRPADRVNHLRMILDDRQRAMLISINHLIREQRRRLTELADEFDRRGPRAKTSVLRTRLADLQQRLDRAMYSRLRIQRDRVATADAELAGRHPKNAIQLNATRLTGMQERLKCAAEAILNRQTDRIKSLDSQLHALSPERILRRGFTLTVSKKSGQMIRSSQHLSEHDRIITRFHDGEIESTVRDPAQPELFE